MFLYQYITMITFIGYVVGAQNVFHSSGHVRIKLCTKITMIICYEFISCKPKCCIIHAYG